MPEVEVKVKQSEDHINFVVGIGEVGEQGEIGVEEGGVTADVDVEVGGIERGLWDVEVGVARAEVKEDDEDGEAAEDDDDP